MVGDVVELGKTRRHRVYRVLKLKSHILFLAVCETRFPRSAITKTSNDTVFSGGRSGLSPDVAPPFPVVYSLCFPLLILPVRDNPAN